MSTRRPASEPSLFADLDCSQTEVLSLALERALLQEMADCKRKLTRALEGLQGIDVPRAGDDPQALARYIAHTRSRGGSEQARLGAVHRRYCEIRTRLALANMKLVAHVAKRFRDRGIPYADLIQEGFCGLLEAIDRFDLSHRTKLATYATWWIRQAMQSAVASGAYPVRLAPRHLRQLAQDQEQKERTEPGRDPASGDDSTESGLGLIPFIHAATRPAVSLDATRILGAHFSLLQTISAPVGDPTSNVDTNEAIGRLMEVLRPREQEVLSLRFGLRGRERLSLSQVGRLLDVSKERVRQIEDRALEKLKARAEEQNLGERHSSID
jgi:RNA polymerase primary sigma factor